MFHAHERREIQGSTFLYKGGGSGNSEKLQRESMKQSQQQFDQQMALMQASMEKEMPAIPKPQPTAPAPTKTSAEVARASDDARRNAARKRGLLMSMRGAGDTGGNAVGGRSSLLG